MNEEHSETLLRFTGDWPALAVFAAALALALLMFFFYRRELRFHNGVARWVPALLRALAVFVLALGLAGPVLRKVTKYRHLGRVVIAVDASASMSFSDLDASSKTKVQSQKSASRFVRAEDALLNPVHSLVTLLSQKHDVELFALRGSKSERIWWRRDGGADTSGEMPQHFAFKPDATLTNLNAPLRDALGPNIGGSALVVLTDGQHNAPGSPEEFATSLSESGTPIFTVGYG
ncbi:MAG: vWA domain-containing protein, partial [Verrucomicrobiaceae bacterium]